MYFLECGVLHHARAGVEPVRSRTRTSLHSTGFPEPLFNLRIRHRTENCKDLPCRNILHSLHQYSRPAMEPCLTALLFPDISSLIVLPCDTPLMNETDDHAEIISINCCSVRMVIPSSCAFASLLPAFSPQMR